MRCCKEQEVRKGLLEKGVARAPRRGMDDDRGPREGWMMTKDLGGMLLKIGFPGEVQMMTGGLGEMWMMIRFLDRVMIQDLVPRDHLPSQVHGERRKRLEKRVGVHLENQDRQKNKNGIETKRRTEIIKIERRMTRTLNEIGTERERERERERDGDQEDCFRRPRDEGGWRRGPAEESSSWRYSSHCDEDREDHQQERDDHRDLRDRRDLRDDRDQRGPPLRSEQEEASSWRRTDDRKDDWTEERDPPRRVPPQLFQEIEKGRENEKVKRRKHPGELRKIGSSFVILRMKLMKMDGP